MKFSIFAILLVLAFNCSAQNWPNWVTQPQLSNDYITAVGIGESRLAAKQAAITEITNQLSINVSSTQVQKLVKENNRVESYFEQETALTSLPFTLTGLVELKSMELNDLFALQVGVKKVALVKTLQDDLAALSRLSAPQSDAEQRFLWALQNSGRLEVAAKKLAVLEHLSNADSPFRPRLNNLLDERSRAFQAISCKVVGANNISTIKSALHSALPQSGSIELWMRPQVQWHYAQSNQNHFVRAKLTLALTRSQSPFKVLLQHDLLAEESDSSQHKAKQKVINNLVQQLKAPASDWLFDIKD